jgi:hypothetical protein
LPIYAATGQTVRDRYTPNAQCFVNFHLGGDVQPVVRKQMFGDSTAQAARRSDRDDGIGFPRRGMSMSIR